MRSLADLNQSEIATTTLDAIGVANRFVFQHENEIRFVKDMGVWLTWADNRWQIEPKVGTIQEMAKATIMSLYDEAKGAVQSGDEHRNKLLLGLIRNLSGRSDVLSKLASSDPRISCESADLDRDLHLLNCPNGTVDLRTGILRKHDRVNLITKITPYDYDPKTLTPDSPWLTYLSQVQPDEEVRNYLQLLVGYSMIGGVTRHVVPFLHGKPRSGKSRFVEAIVHHAGGYGHTTNVDLFVQGGSSVSRYDLADLRGARFISMAEFDETVKVNTSLLKRVTGGDTVKARHAYGHPFEFQPQGTLWVSTNHLPYVGADDAAWSRVRRIPFNVSFLGREDVTLPERLAQDPAVLAWMVQGAIRYCAEPWSEPQSVVEATAEVQHEQDQVKRFLAEHTYNVEGGRVVSAALYATYQNWCFENGEKPRTADSLGKRLTDIGYGKQKSNGVTYRSGLEMREPRPVGFPV